MLAELIVVIISQYMYVTHIIMLYILNLYSDMCQLFLSKTGVGGGGSGESVGFGLRPGCCTDSGTSVQMKNSFSSSEKGMINFTM